MKTLIVYYSLEGNTKWMAEQIASQLSADMLRLVPKKAYPDKGFKKFFWGGKSAVMKETPALEPYTFNKDAYECIIFATPIWAGTFAPPLRTFIQSETLSGKQFAFAACSSGGGADKAFAALRNLLGVSGKTAELSLTDPLTHPKDDDQKAISAFCGQLER